MPDDPFLTKMRGGGGAAVADDPFLARMRGASATAPKPMTVMGVELDPEQQRAYDEFQQKSIAELAAAGPKPMGAPMPDIDPARLQREASMSQARQIAEQHGADEEGFFKESPFGRAETAVAQGFVQPIREAMNAPTKGYGGDLDEALNAGLRIGGHAVFLPITAGLAFTGLDVPISAAVGPALQGLERGATNLTGSKAAGAAASLAAQILAAKGAHAVASEVGAIRGVQPNAAALAEIAKAPDVRIEGPLDTTPTPVAPLPPATLPSPTAEVAPAGIAGRTIGAPGLRTPVDTTGDVPVARLPSAGTMKKVAAMGNAPKVETAATPVLTEVAPEVSAALTQPKALDPFLARLRGAEPAPSPAKAESAQPTPAPATEQALPAEAVPAPKDVPAAPEPIREGTAFTGRPMGGEAGAALIPNIGKPLPEELPPGTPAERAAVADVKERIRFGETPKPPIAERATDLAKKTEAEIVRREAPLRRAETNITGSESPTGVTAQAKFAQGSSQGAAENLYRHGYLEEKTTPIVRDALKDVVKSGRRLSDVSAYATAKRAITDYEPNKLESGFDPAQAKTTVDLYEKNHPEVVKAADAIAEVNRQLRSNFAEADRWDPKRLAEMEERNKYPIEFARDFGDAAERNAGQPKGRGAAFPGPTMKARTGGDAPVRDPLVRLQENMRRMIAGADQARVKHAFLDLVNSNPQKAATIVERLTPQQLKAQIPDFDAIAQAMNPATSVEDFGKTFDAYDKAYKAGIIPDGKGGFLRVKDPALAAAIKGGDLAEANALLKTAAAITAVQRTGITQASPSFLPRNFWRDIQTYAMQSKETNDFTLWKNYTRGLYHAIRGELENVGVKGTPFNEAARRARLEGFYEADTTARAPEKLARMEEGFANYYARRPQQIPLAAAKGVLDAWKSLNSGIEHAPRYAALIDDLEAQGWKPGQPLTRDMLVRAGNAAQEATVNFRLGGETGKAINRYAFNFWNPAVQGVEQLRQTFSNRPGLATRRAITYGVAPAVGLYLYWQSSPKRREAWNRMPAWRRAQMNIPIEDENGNVLALSLPVPQEAGVFYSGATAAMDAIDHKDVQRAIDQSKEMWNRAAPGPLGKPGDWMSWVPSAAQPIVEVGANRFAFSGRPINPRNMEGGENIAPQDVRQPYSSRLGYIVSKFLHDVSGSKLTTADIDALISGYGGTAARDVLRTAPGGETEKSDMPIVGGFFPRLSESKFTDDYYKLRDTFQGQQNLSRALRKSDPAEAAKMRLPTGLATDIADIDQGLKLAMDRYRSAPENVRPAIAAHMDNLAKRGLRILATARVGQPYQPKKKETP